MVCGLIRASVDALCRDGAGHVPRDPCTNSPVSRPRSISEPEKIHQHHPETYLQLTQCLLGAHIPSSFHASGISNARISNTSRHRILLLLLLRPSAAVESTKPLNPTDRGVASGTASRALIFG